MITGIKPWLVVQHLHMHFFIRINDNMVFSIVSLLVAFASAIFSFIAIFYSYVHDKREKLSFVTKNLSGISVLLADAYKALSYGEFDPEFNISEIENTLIVGSHNLFSFGISYNYDNLVQFSVINPINTNEREQCFFHVFFSLEDEYLNFRKKILEKGEKINVSETDIIVMYIKCFRELLDLSALYTLSFLYKKKGSYSRKKSEEYYKKLKYIYEKGMNIC